MAESTAAATKVIARSSSDPPQETAPGHPAAGASSPPAEQLEVSLKQVALLRKLAATCERGDIAVALQQQTGTELRALAQELGVLRDQLKRAPTAPDEEEQRHAEDELRASILERFERWAAEEQSQG